jgi:hypothetical protein
MFFAIINSFYSLYPFNIIIILYNLKDKTSNIFKLSKTTSKGYPIICFKVIPFSLLIANIKVFKLSLENNKVENLV